jgi:hypothetical protein
MSERILSLVEPSKYFWFVTGDCAKSLEELATKIRLLDRASFKFHVNSEKDDFRTWIEEVIGDYGLARQLKSSMNKKNYVALIDHRIGLLRNDIESVLPSFKDHLEKRGVERIMKVLDEINSKIQHHSDILDKYDHVREIYSSLHRVHKQKVYPEIIKTFNRMQELWDRINY